MTFSAQSAVTEQKLLRQRLDAAFAEAAQPLSRDEVTDIVRNILGSMDGDISATDLRLYKEVVDLAKFIETAKQEIAALQPAEIRDEHIRTATDELDAVIDELNTDPACNGYIVQLPLPKHLDAGRTLTRIDPAKDADGLHPMNLGNLVLNQPGPLPCTPRGIVELLRRYEVPIAGANVTVIGRGVTVGRSIGLLLTRKSENATVTLCHTGTKDLAAEVRRADIVVAAAGSPALVTPDMVKPGAAVLDVGITRTEAGLVGDVHPDVREVAGYLAPMPGGVGPMTVAMLLVNVVEAAERR